MADAAAKPLSAMQTLLVSKLKALCHISWSCHCSTISDGQCRFVRIASAHGPTLAGNCLCSAPCKVCTPFASLHSGSTGSSMVHIADDLDSIPATRKSISLVVTNARSNSSNLQPICFSLSQIPGKRQFQCADVDWTSVFYFSILNDEKTQVVRLRCSLCVLAWFACIEQALAGPIRQGLPLEDVE